MVISIKHAKFKFFQVIPLFLLFYISLNGSSTLDFKLFTINLHYILVYFWILRRPEVLGYGFIFFSGIITDVMFGLPLGVTARTLLIIAAVATYVRVVTVRVGLISDWLGFIPALILASLIYFISLYFSGYTIDYLYLIMNSLFTFTFYPLLWALFSFLLNLMR